MNERPEQTPEGRVLQPLGPGRLLPDRDRVRRLLDHALMGAGDRVGRSDDLTATLLDLARAGDREGFIDLARMTLNGESRDRAEAFWQRTRARLGLPA